jgi:hypothetical protein
VPGPLTAAQALEVSLNLLVQARLAINAGDYDLGSARALEAAAWTQVAVALEMGVPALTLPDATLPDIPAGS